MYQRLCVFLGVVFLAACGGPDDSDSSSSSSAVPVSSSSISVSSSSNPPVVSSVASSSSSAASSSGGLVLSAQGNVQAGAERWGLNCRGCHGNPGDGYISDGAFRLNAIDLVAAYDRPGGHRGYEGLQYYIHHEMPNNGGWQACIGSCAEDVAAYMRSWVPELNAAACENTDPVLYGKRQFVLLTSTQYQKSVEDLLGVTENLGANLSNNDGVIGGFPNMNHRSVNSQIADVYLDNAEQLAAWAVANNRPFACTNTGTCAERFVDEFAFRAFRRPLDANERADYLALFNQYGAQEGMELALAAVFSAPQFLYRSEAGVDIATARLAGYYTNSGGGADSSNYVSDGRRTTVRAVDFSDLRAGGPEGEGSEQGTLGHNIWSDGTISHSFNFHDVTVVEIEAKGSPYDDNWPLMTVSVGGQVIAMQTVENAEYETYTFVVSGRTGSQALGIAFSGDQGRTPYDVWGNDKNLYINSASVSRGVEVEPAQPELDPLVLADPDAYVLTPFEYATALAYMFTGSTPDRELLTAAAEDALTTPQQVERQVLRLINSDRGRQHFGEFAGLWLGTNQVTRASRPSVPEFTSDVRRAMAQEIQELFRHVFYEEDVPFSEFYSADYTFLNQTLADFYGIAGNFGSNFVQVPTSGRGGAISSGAFMAVNAHNERTSPIKRAVRVREAVLCHHIDPPNAELDGDRAKAQMLVENYEMQHGGIDSRKFYELYTEDPACAGCHAIIINPMFGLEDFDNVGRLRAPAGAGSVYEVVAGGNQMPVSLAGTLYGVESVRDTSTIEFSGSRDLSLQLSETDAIKSCLVRQGFRFVTGLPVSLADVDGNVQETLSESQQADYACAAAQMEQALIVNGESPKAMFGKLGTLDLVRFRK